MSGPDSASDAAQEAIQQEQSGNDSGADATDSTDDKAGSADGGEQRAANLLRERRGRESTINTSFRGLLEPRESQPKRKTLLGG